MRSRSKRNRRIRGVHPTWGPGFHQEVPAAPVSDKDYAPKSEVQHLSLSVGTPAGSAGGAVPIRAVERTQESIVASIVGSLTTRPHPDQDEFGDQADDRVE